MNYLVLYNKPLFWECWIRPFRYPARIETLARIIHECRHEAFETEARRARGSARRPKAPADGSDSVAGIHDLMKPNG